MPTDLVIDRLNKYKNIINKFNIDNILLMKRATRRYVNIKIELSAYKEQLEHYECEEAMASAQVVPDSTKDSYQEIEHEVMELYQALANVHTTLEVLLSQTKTLDRKVRHLNRTGELIEKFENNL